MGVQVSQTGIPGSSPILAREGFACDLDGLQLYFLDSELRFIGERCSVFLLDSPLNRRVDNVSQKSSWWT